MKKNRKVLILDMDNTLYPGNCGFGEGLGIEKETGNEKYAYQLYKKYGTTLSGLIELGYEVDGVAYNNYINGVDPKGIVEVDPKLREFLIRMKEKYEFEIYIFSNADEMHVVKMMKHLNIEDLIINTVCMEDIDRRGLINKPHRIAYEKAIEIFKLNPDRDYPGEDVYFIEDTVDNAVGGTKFFTKNYLIYPKFSYSKLSEESSAEIVKSGVILLSDLYEFEKKLVEDKKKDC